MPRSVVGLLAALGVVLSSLLAFVHGDLTPLVILTSGTATGLAPVPGAAAYINPSIRRCVPRQSECLSPNRAFRCTSLRLARLCPDPPALRIWAEGHEHEGGRAPRGSTCTRCEPLLWPPG
jgi:hypothetical protein